MIIIRFVSFLKLKLKLEVKLYLFDFRQVLYDLVLMIW